MKVSHQVLIARQCQRLARQRERFVLDYLADPRAWVARHGAPFVQRLEEFDRLAEEVMGHLRRLVRLGWAVGPAPLGDHQVSEP